MPDGSALMIAVDAVLDEGPAVTAVPAPPELGVELLEYVRTHSAQRQFAQCGTDVQTHHRLVVHNGVLLRLVNTHPGIERITEARPRASVRLFLHLVDEPAQDALRFFLVRGRGGQPVRLARHRVDTCVYQHLKGPVHAGVCAHVGVRAVGCARHVRFVLDDRPDDIDQIT